MEKSMSSVLSKFIDKIYEIFGENHHLSRQANNLVVAYSHGSEDEELAEMVSNMIRDFDLMNK